LSYQPRCFMTKLGRKYCTLARFILNRIGESQEIFIIHSLINAKPYEKILDIGCGRGHHSYALAKKGSIVTAIDVSADTIVKAKQKYGLPNIDFCLYDAMKLEHNKYWDKVLLSHVVEHLSLTDGGILLKKIYNALKDGGVLVMALPINERERKRLLRRPLHPDHKHCYTLGSIQKELASAGFKVTQIRTLLLFGIEVPYKLAELPPLRPFVAVADICAIKATSSYIPDQNRVA
jgi:cyclopropane fatty-acyl-phospholipid synthase-like methyltransferase